MEEIDSSLELNNQNEKALGLIPILHSLQPNKKEVDIVLGGVSQTREISIQSTSQIPNTAPSTNVSLNFNYDFSNEVSIDAAVLLQVKFTIRVAGAAVGTEKYIDYSQSNIALAQNPLARAMKSLNVRLNNNQVQVNPHLWVNALAKYWDNDEWRSYQSFSQPDPANAQPVFTSAVDAAAYLKFNGGNSVYNSAKTDGLERSRMSYIPEVTVVTAGANNTAQVLDLTYTITEPLFHPFFVRQDNQVTALHRIKNLSVDINFNDLRACFTDVVPAGTAADRSNVGAGVVWSINANPVAAVADITAAAATTWIRVTEPKLLVRTYNPVVEIPREVSMPFHDMQVRQFPFSLEVNATPLTYQVSTGSLMFNQVPEKIFLFCRPQADVNNVRQADKFCAIDRLVFRTTADAGGLASADTAQLFEMCKRNGLRQQTISEFSNLQGSVVCLDFSKGDIASFIPGMLGNFTFDITAYVRNTCYPAFGLAHNVAGSSNGCGFRGALNAAGEDPVNWNFTVVAIQSGQMIADGNALRIVLGIDQQTAQEMAQSKFGAIYDQHRAVSREGMGSGFFSSMRDHLRSAGRFLTSNNQIRNVAKQIAKDAILPLAQKYAQAAQQSKDPRAATVGMVAAPALSMLSQQLGGKAEGSGIRLLG